MTYVKTFSCVCCPGEDCHKDFFWEIIMQSTLQQARLKMTNADKQYSLFAKSINYDEKVL